MCFSASASFASSVPIAAVGVATVLQVQRPREWLFASLPLLFAWHQFDEGFVWLALEGASPVGGLDAWGFAYMLFSHVLLPLIMPLSIWLIEPDRRRGHRLLPFLVLGAGLAAYQLWAICAVQTDVFIRNDSVVYDNPASNNVVVGVLYVLATCGALFASGYRTIILLGVVNLLGLLLVLAFKQYAFTSLWCAYAALVSVLVYAHFHRRRVA